MHQQISKVFLSSIGNQRSIREYLFKCDEACNSGSRDFVIEGSLGRFGWKVTTRGTRVELLHGNTFCIDATADCKISTLCLPLTLVQKI